MKKYVVYITYYKGDKLPPWYIGSSYEEKVKKGYNGSVVSKRWRDVYAQEQKENKHLFKTKILSYHETYKLALKEELRLQKMHKVVPNKEYFNEAYATVNGCFGRDVSGELHPRYGMNNSKEMIEKANRTKIQRGSNIIGGIKCSATMQSKEWKETTGKEATLKANETKVQKGSNIIGAMKQSNTKSSKQWKKTKGKEGIKKMKETFQEYEENGKTIIENIVERGQAKRRITQNSKEWKEKVSGKNSVYAKKYIIYNEDKVLFEDYTTVEQLIKITGISASILRRSLLEGIKLYDKARSSDLMKMNNKNNMLVYFTYKGFKIEETK